MSTSDRTSPDPDELIDRYFAAMRRGSEGESELLDLFARDAVYDEPFSGLPPATGISAIRDRLRLGWEHPLPDLELDVLSVEVVGDEATTTWECRSSAFSEPRRGRDRYRFVDGRIVELTVSFLTERP